MLMVFWAAAAGSKELRLLLNIEFLQGISESEKRAVLNATILGMVISRRL
jgi:hypothetical protein